MSKIREAYNYIDTLLSHEGFISEEVAESMKVLGETVAQVEKLLEVAKIQDVLPKAELRVYLIRLEDYQEEVEEANDTAIYHLSDEAFMDEAERQGNVFTLPYFESCFNCDEEVNQDGDYIRFISVPVV